jgi:hypothetical protein
MDFYKPRKLRFKAWNKESKLLMRLNSIECVKGELIKKDHILLQFTGLLDKQQEELYELDVVLIDSVQYVIAWNEEKNGWCLKQLPVGTPTLPLEQTIAQQSVRLWSFFESDK